MCIQRKWEKYVKMVVNSLTIKEHMVDVNSMIKPYEDSIKPKEKPQKKEAKRENKINLKKIKDSKIVNRALLKKEPRATVRIAPIDNRTAYFKKTWETEKRNLLSWK